MVTVPYIERCHTICRSDGDPFNMTVAGNMADPSARRDDTAPTMNNNVDKKQRESNVTAFERLTYNLSHNETWRKEAANGHRIGFYKIRADLGSGNFCKVKSANHALAKETVAIKILDKTKLDAKTRRLLSREISSMEQLHHPNIIRLYEVIDTMSRLHMVMEYASGGELFRTISEQGKLSDARAKHYFKQVLSAVEHMHSYNIIHRDLKAENVFIARSNLVKVGDFGFSTVSTKDSTLNTFCGSPPYAAPELFKDEHYVGVYVDIWALGILLYFMVYGVMPFRAETVGKLKKNILAGSFPMTNSASEEVRSLIGNILMPVPTDRYSIEDIKHSIWLEGEDFPKADGKYNLRPPVSLEACATDEEREAIRVLYEFGVTNEQLEECRDSKDSITGTYRVVLHRIQKRKAAKPRKISTLSQRSQRRGERDARTNHTRETQTKSKFCTIL